MEYLDCSLESRDARETVSNRVVTFSRLTTKMASLWHRNDAWNNRLQGALTKWAELKLPRRNSGNMPQATPNLLDMAGSGRMISMKPKLKFITDDLELKRFLKHSTTRNEELNPKITGIQANGRGTCAQFCHSYFLRNHCPHRRKRLQGAFEVNPTHLRCASLAHRTWQLATAMYFCRKSKCTFWIGF